MQEALSDPVLSAFAPKNKRRAKKSCPEHPILHRPIRGVYLSRKSSTSFLPCVSTDSSPSLKGKSRKKHGPTGHSLFFLMLCRLIFFFIRLGEHLQIKWFSFLNVIIKLHSRVVVPIYTLHQQPNCFPSAILRLIRLLHLARLRNTQTYHFGSYFPAAKWRKLTKQTSRYRKGGLGLSTTEVRLFRQRGLCLTGNGLRWMDRGNYRQRIPTTLLGKFCYK